MRISHPLTRSRPMTRSLLRSACALLVVALSACDSTSGTDGVAGSYSMQVVNGQRPPVTVWANRPGGALQVMDADVRLRENGEVSVELTTRVMGTNGTPGAEQSTTYEGTYEQAGDVLELGFLESAAGEQVAAEGVVISAREIAVTLAFAVSAYTGYVQYPVSIIARR